MTTITVDRSTKLLLAAIVLLLGILVLRPVLTPVPVQAQSGQNLYIEPGTTTLRDPETGGETVGKLVIDLYSGEVWGFPMVLNPLTRNPTSKALYLGKYDFTTMKRR